MRTKRGHIELLSLFIFLGFILHFSPNAAGDLLPIGQIQGRGMISPYLDQEVTFRGIVTGLIEDQNTLGRRYYTVFAQDLPGFEDGDPLSSDGIAIFMGQDKPSLTAGDIVYVTGKVTEYYGLTEIDDDGLWLTIESRNHSGPLPVELSPPADMQESSRYFERLEGMLVFVPKAVTVGPTHTGCGLAVVREDTQLKRVFRREATDPAGQIINVINASDVDCSDLPALAVGDLVEGLAGPLTFHFDQFKIIQQNPGNLVVSQAEHDVSTSGIPLSTSQISIASFNLDNFFDDVDDTGDIAEPKFSEVELTLKQDKLSAAIAAVLSCPTLIGVQEVEKESLLVGLSEKLRPKCGFNYSVNHLDAPDSRGSDLALLSDPRRVDVVAMSQNQTCSSIQTGVFDPSIQCLEGEEPLFSRPPLQVFLDIDGQPLSIYVNHFKSKREGELETTSRRVAQAQYLRDLMLAANTPDSDPAIIALGDFNDYDRSPVMDIFLDSGKLVDGLEKIPETERYSYIFDGASQLVDWILVSPWLEERIVSARIFHVNADYPYQLGQSMVGDELYLRSSDHDIPFLVIDLSEDFLRDVKNQVVEEGRGNLTVDLQGTATVLVPGEPDPDPIQLATTKEFGSDNDIAHELSSEDSLSTPEETTENGQGESRARRYSFDLIVPLAGLALFVGAVLIILWSRRSGARG